MNPVFEQIVNIYKAMPLPKKIAAGAVLLMVAAGFILMFFLANRIDFQPAYTKLSSEDAAQIVAKLKEMKVPYRLTENGTCIKVPAERVYDIRLTMAGAGIPKGGAVGFEIFNETDFGTTEFVQKLNYKRALQGELARTIREFEEVEDARVIIVMAKDSLFIEETKPPSASVLLKLKSKPSREKISAIVYLVASSVEGLDPDLITVVDTNGNVLSKGGGIEEKLGAFANSQLEYKTAFEKNLARRIQTMLEKIAGKGKAIVRVTADMDFDQVDISEEIYDPDVQVIRSRQNIVESSDRTNKPVGGVSSVNPVTAGSAQTSEKISDVTRRQDETTNYEINKTIRRIVKPAFVLKRLSVAVVLDGTYLFETDKSGVKTRKYVERSQAELDQFEKIVKNAMGYDADREDQVSVESFPFSYMEDMTMSKSRSFDWQKLVKQYGRTFINFILILFVFFFVVRPLVKTIKSLKVDSDEKPALVSMEDGKALSEPDKREALPEPEAKMIQSSEMTLKEKAVALAMQDVERTANIVTGWLDEAR